jgi:enoyl-CoA hydratase/carnithine racemase
MSDKSDYFLRLHRHFSLGEKELMSAFFTNCKSSMRCGLNMGIVDKVVPQETLEKAAVDTARRFAQKPARSLAGLKKLINYSLIDLKDYLAVEYKELIKILEIGC